MKRTKYIIMTLVISILILSLMGCKKKDTDMEEQNINNEDNAEIESNVETGKEHMIAELEKLAELINNKLTDEAVEFVDRKIKDFTSIEGDEMVLKLQEMLEKNIAKDNLFKDYEGELMEIAGDKLFFPKEKVGDIKDEKLREAIENAYKNRYKLINMEGQFYPIVDYEQFKAYDNYVSSEVKDYIDIRATMSNEPMAMDGALTITYDQLGNRILKVEEYLKKYFQGKRYEEVLGFYEDWLWLYLNGAPNTPIADADTSTIYKDVFESYKKVANTADSTTAFVVNKYLNRIEGNKGIIDISILEDNGELVNEALSLLEASK